MQGSADGYVGELTAPEKCFCHYQHFSDRFLFFLFFLNILFIYLASLGLSCSMRHLESSLQHANS